MDALRHNISSRTSIMKLTTTIVIALSADFLLLLIWHAQDPMQAEFFVDYELELQGHWRCTCNHVEWLIVQLLFLLIMILFGVYVIYQTWSFQRKALLVETRWVLLALYNVVLTLCAVAPLLALVRMTDGILSLIAIISIDLSGGGIVAAVLLPRVLNKLEWSTHSRDKDHTTIPGSAIPKSGTGKSHSKDKLDAEKMERSRTPAEELAHRLEDPKPLRKKEIPKKLSREHLLDDSQLVPSQIEVIEMQPLPGRLDSPSTRNPEESISLQQLSSRLPDESHPFSPYNQPRQSRPSRLQWSPNPMLQVDSPLIKNTGLLEDREENLDTSTASADRPLDASRTDRPLDASATSTV